MTASTVQISAPTKTRKASAQWAAQFLVAGELARHGYEVSFTMGNNTPVADLMVGHPNTGAQFWVDVKGQLDGERLVGRFQSAAPESFLHSDFSGFIPERGSLFYSDASRI